MKYKRKKGVINKERTLTRMSWYRMIRRCYCKTDPKYPNYGGRGIKVCKRWLESLDNFIADMGHRPEDKTLDRKNNNGNYTPKNCRWATDSEQRRNKRSNIKNSKGQIISDIKLPDGLTRWSFYRRVDRGWTVEEAMTLGRQK